MPSRGLTACHLHRKALPFFLSSPPRPSPKRSRTKRGRERRGERQQTIPSHQDGTWAWGGHTRPHGSRREGPSDAGWVLNPLCHSLAGQVSTWGCCPSDSLSLHLTPRHAVAPRAELWIPPFPLGHGVPARDIS